MTTNPRKTYTARGPEDLIALAPYVLGFHPDDSVVLLTFGGAEPFHVRVDLPDSLADQEELDEVLRAVVRKHAIPTVALLLYTDDAEAAAAQAELLRDGLVGDGVRVVDAIRVTDDAYYDALDPDAPGVPYDVSAHPLAVSRIVDGQVALDSRAELADTLVGCDTDDAEAVGHAATRFADSAAVMLEKGLHPQVFLHDEARWLRRVLAAALERRLQPHEVGRIVVLLQRLDLRDVAWSTLAPDQVGAQVGLWRDLVRRAPHDLLAPPAALLAFAAWLAGDGALAWCAIDRCREADPDYSMATEIARLLQHAVPPSAWTGCPEAGTESRPESRSA